MSTFQVYAGSYTDGESKGIYLFSLDGDSGKLNLIETYEDFCNNPSYLTIHGDYLYALSELEKSGAITAFKRNPGDGRLKKLNSVDTDNVFLCHLNVWPSGKFISASGYGDGRFGSGSLTICPILEDGKVGEPCNRLLHVGVGHLSKTRQECAHIHSSICVSEECCDDVNTSKQQPRKDKYLYIADLGLDKLFCYEPDDNGKIKLSSEKMHIKVPNGEGPRHFIFREKGKYLYLVTEMASRVHVYERQDDSTYKELQSLSTLSDSFEGENTAAEVRISGDDRFLYVSNRGENTLAVFGINGNDGTLEPARRCDCGGDFPRNFSISPDDNYIITANQHSGTLAVLKRDIESGLVSGKLDEVKVPQASFVSII